MSATEPINQYPFVEKRGPLPCAEHEKRISLTEQAVMSIKQTNEGMTTKLDLILAQITRVAILEEKHNNQQTDLTRAHNKIHDLGKDHERLAEEIRAFMNYTKGQAKIMWALSAVVGGLVIKALFFAANNGMTP